LTRSNIEQEPAYAKHLATVFQPHPTENLSGKEQEAQNFYLYQLKPPFNRPKRVQEVINSPNPK
jgi:hypothetical protein